MRNLVACNLAGGRVDIVNLESAEKQEFQIKGPNMCAASRHHVAVTTVQGIYVYNQSTQEIEAIPDSMGCICAAFHPKRRNSLAIGFKDGSVRIWDIVKRHKEPVTIDIHEKRTTDVKFSPDGRLLISSEDNTASITTLNAQFRVVSSIRLPGHTAKVNSIVYISSAALCVT